LKDAFTLYKIQAVHGSDSRSYSKRGEIDDARLAEIFETYTDPPHDSINVRQMIRFMKGNAGPFDPVSFFLPLVLNPLPHGFLVWLVWHYHRVGCFNHPARVTLEEGRCEGSVRCEFSPEVFKERGSEGIFE